MELHKLKVTDNRTSPVCHRYTIAGSNIRVGGLSPQLTCASGCHNHSTRGYGTNFPIRIEHPNTNDAANVSISVGDNQVDCHVRLEQF